MAVIIVIKLGGDVLEGAALARVAQSVRQVLAQDPAPRIVVVHGGGAQVTSLCAKLGLPTQMVAGRRITDGATLDVLKMIVAGRLNVDLCAALQAQGVAAVGLHAGTGMVRATHRPPRVLTGAGALPVDLGLVGDVASFDLALLTTLWQAGRVPVLSCLGLTAQSEILNLNADLTASQLAVALCAHALVAVSAVGGVRRDKDDPGTRIGRLSAAEARAAIASGQVRGGMIPKLEEALSPLQAGVGSVQIVGPDEIATALRHPGTVGTLLVP